MNKIWIIIQREFMTKVRKKSFIILTLLMPLIMAIVVAVPALLAQADSGETFTVGIVDNTGIYAKEFKDRENIKFVVVDDKRPIEEITNQLKVEGALYNQILYIPDTLTQAKDGTALIYSVEETPTEVEREVNYVLRDKIRTDRLSAFNLPNVEEIIKSADVGFSVKTIRKTDDGDKESDATFTALIGLFLSTFIYMFIMAYGSMIMNSVMEEKTNRIVEIIVSSVKPWQLMAGKIIGVGLVGLFQMAIWGTMIVGISLTFGTIYGVTTIPETGAGITPEQMAQMQEMANSPVADILKFVGAMDFVSITIFFVLFFIGGYLLFASLFAAFGAAVNEMQDASQFTMPIIMIFIFALYAAMFSIDNSNGPLAVWCSYIPLTSPIVMMVRMPFDIPVWSVLLSLVILYITAIATTILSSKIYRIGILMYGQKPSMKDLIKWLRY